MTDVERRVALEAIATEVRDCTKCRLHETRTKAVPGEGDPSTEVVFIGEGPGFNEDQQGRPFVGAAGGFLTQLLGSIGWRRDQSQAATSRRRWTLTRSCSAAAARTLATVAGSGNAAASEE